MRLLDPLGQLSTLALLVDWVGALVGGQLLTALHRHSFHGDTRHSNLSHIMLEAASQPWYQALYSWTVQGVLVTTDFFVQRTTREDDPTTKDVWHSTFRLAQDQVPEICRPILFNRVSMLGRESTLFGIVCWILAGRSTWVTRTRNHKYWDIVMRATQH